VKTPTGTCVQQSGIRFVYSFRSR